VQFLINNFDALRLGQDIGNTINGGTYTSTNTVEPVIAVYGGSTYITSATINGPGAQGFYLGSSSACVNDNTFNAGTSLGAGIWSNGKIGSEGPNFQPLARGSCDTVPACARARYCIAV
jgi:hypothetical protein